MADHGAHKRSGSKKERHRLLGISAKRALAGQLRRKLTKEKRRT